MGQCVVCGREGRAVSEVLGLCADCLRAEKPDAMARAAEVHRRARAEFALPEQPPTEGIRCGWCANDCRIPPGERGFCAVRRNEGGKLTGGTPRSGRVSWYHDPLPTNCVADWVCEGHHQRGKTNLAVFYESCSFDCLFCQNWHYRERGAGRRLVSAEQLASAVDDGTECICYFGGDPSTQMAHALAASRLALERHRVRVCWETNGAMSRAHIRAAAELSLRTGGCVKFDLKAHSRGIHVGLCGVGNERTLENFRWVAALARQRPEPPLLVASTLLVPGYVDAREVEGIARFIASLDRSIPYSLLGFHPDFLMPDLPRTSRRHAEECRQAALAAGLERVHIGNVHVLGPDCY